MNWKGDVGIIEQVEKIIKHNTLWNEKKNGATPFKLFGVENQSVVYSKVISGLAKKEINSHKEFVPITIKLSYDYRVRRGGIHIEDANVPPFLKTFPDAMKLIAGLEIDYSDDDAGVKPIMAGFPND